MIGNILLKKNSVDKKFVGDLAIFFYSNNQGNGTGFKANIKTSLNYFGEYLERHEDRGVSMFDIMAAVCCKNNIIELPEQQIFDGQYEMFVNRVEAKREELEFDFELEVLYSLFLSKTKKEELSKNVLKNVLRKMTFDNNLLIICGLIHNNYIALDDECRSIIIERLKSDKIKIDVDDLMNSIELKNNNLRFISEHVYLKNIVKVLDLKKSDFKDSVDVFENLKYLKKIGTRESVYEKAKGILDIKEDEFYLLALKIAADSYADGSSLVKTNEYLIEKLENTISPNNEWYNHLPYFKLRVRGGIDDGQISLDKVDYSNVEDKYYDSMIKAYCAAYSRMNYSQIKNICQKESFIDFMLAKKDSLTYDEKNFIMKVIQCEIDNKELIKMYYDVVKDFKNIKNSDICIFCRATLVDSDYVLDKVFSSDNRGIFIDYDAREIIEACKHTDLIDVLIRIMDRLNNNNVTLGLYVDRTLSGVSKFLEGKFYSEDLSDEYRKVLINKVNDFNFLYLSKYYYSFLLRNIKNDFFKDTLDIDEEEIKEIAEYLLKESKRFLDDNETMELKQIILSEEDIFKESLRVKVADFISKCSYSNRVTFPSTSLVDFIKECPNKNVAIDYLKSVVLSVDVSPKYDMEFMSLIRLIIMTELFEEEEVTNLIRERLFVTVL